MPSIVLRGSTYHLRARVPKRFGGVENKAFVWRSLRTDSRSEATRQADVEWRRLMAAWEARLAGAGRDADGCRARYEAAARLAAEHGFSYRTAEELAAGPADELTRRLAVWRASGGGAEVAEAILGGVAPPILMVSDLVEESERLFADDNKHKSPRQMRNWLRERRRAVKSLIDALGRDIPVLEITKEIASAHLIWASKQVRDGARGTDSVNKDFSYLSSMITRYRESLGDLDPPRPYSRVKIRTKHKEEQRRKPWTDEMIWEHVLRPGSIDALNDEAAAVLVIVAETGARPSEIWAAPAAAFRLDHEVPHIMVENGGREVKTKDSKREIPLIGAALEAARRHPNGFPRYRDSKTTDWSATVNKFLRENGLPEPYTAGGLRHRFEDRMEEAGFRMDTAAAMMGHSVKLSRGREHYGETALEKRARLQRLVTLSWCD